VRPVGASLAEVVVEDLADDRPGLFGVGEEVVQLEHAGIVAASQAALAAERRDTALHADPGAREGGEVLRGADEAHSFLDSDLGLLLCRCWSMGRT